MENVVIKKSIHITVQLYGAFRRYGNGKEVSINVSAPASLNDVRAALAIALDLPETDQDILRQSAFSNQTDILTPQCYLDQDVVLSILPPVCGG